MAHGLSCSAACGIFPDQGSNPCPLHWQADSQPLRHQGSPWFVFNVLLRKFFLGLGPEVFAYMSCVNFIVFSSTWRPRSASCRLRVGPEGSSFCLLPGPPTPHATVSPCRAVSLLSRHHPSLVCARKRPCLLFVFKSILASCGLLFYHLSPRVQIPQKTQVAIAWTTV